MKKKKVFSKILAIALVLGLMLSAFPNLSVFAQEVSSKEKLTEKGELWQPDSNFNALNFEGDLSIEELQSAKLSDEDTPEIVSQESIEENGHVNRLWEQEEDLNSIVFQNRDGTKTMYYYNYPVKYKDANGKIKDKSNKISQTSSGDFTNAENDINTYFPKKLNRNKGIELKFGEYVVEMAPDIKGNSGASRQTGHNKYFDPTEYVQYPNVFDESISLRYTPTFEGYKEDIVLSKYTGINEFSFRLYTDGLSLVMNEDGAYYLIDPLSGEIKTQIGDIVVYDSKPFDVPEEILNESVSNPTEEDFAKKEAILKEAKKNVAKESSSVPKTYLHQYKVKTVKQDNEYLITIIVDEDYLTDKERVYPVYVDPTLRIDSLATNETKNIMDAPIYSNRPTISYGGSGNNYAVVGYQGSNGIGRTLMKFPGLASNSTYAGLDAIQITNLSLHIYEGSGLSNTACIDLWQYTGTNWTENTAKCNNVGWDSYTNNFTWNYINTSGWQTFNLTNMVAKWKNGGSGVGSPLDKGIVIKNYTSEYNSSYRKDFMTTESGNQPYLTFTYVTNIPVSQVCLELSTLTLNVNDTYYLDGSVVPSYATNQTIYYESSNTNVATVGYTSGLVCASSPGTTTITARSAADGSKYATCTVNVKYSFGMSIQNDYPDGCEMGDKNYASFGVYADNLKYELNKEMNEIFDYRGKNSWSNDFKNKNAPGATHSYTNIDDVDLMIFTGHGYAKNRNKSEGLFNYNSMHFGTTNSSVGHPEGNGTIASANFTTEDALYFGYNAKTKWLLAYTCNFLNEKQGDPNVFNMLDRGGRLIMGLSTKSYIVGKEGTDFGQYLLEGYSFKDAFFMAGEDNQDQGSIPIINSNQAKKYAILYYGSEDAGTLNDKITEPLDNVAKTEGKIKTKIINKYWFNDFEED